MKLKKFNEELSKDIFDKLPDSAKKLYYKTIFPELVKDVKELLDLYFADLLDDEDITTNVNVDSIYLETNYYIKYNHGLNDRTFIIRDGGTSKLSKYADTFESMAEYIRYIENRMEQLELEYNNKSIYGDDMFKTKFKKNFIIIGGGFTFLLTISKDE